MRLDAPLREILEQMQDRICHRTTWNGVTALKCPLDFWVYQEIIAEQKPDVILEIGTHRGGGAFALEAVCEAVGHGHVLSIDSQGEDFHPLGRRVSFMRAHAIEDAAKVAPLLGGRVMVIEDSDHGYENTLEILRLYSGVIPVGGYFIVEDTIIAHGLSQGPRPGPYEAVEQFLSENQNFEIDKDRPWPITWNPDGYLRRKA